MNGIKSDFIIQFCASNYANAVGLGCSVSNSRGKLLFEYGNGTEKCKLCKLFGRNNTDCRNTRMFSLHESERFGGKYVFFCPMGLSCFTCTAFGTEDTGLQITVGPFLMVDKEDYIEYELKTVRHFSDEQILSAMPFISELPQIDSSRVSSLMEVLFMTTGFVNSFTDTQRHVDDNEALLQQGRIADYIHALKNGDKMVPYPLNTEHAFIKAVIECKLETAETALDELMAYHLYVSGGDQNLLRLHACELLILVSREVVNKFGNQKTIFTLADSFYSMSTQIKDFQDLTKQLSVTITKMIAIISDRRSDTGYSLSESATRYIQKHCCESNLSLKAVADSLSVSASHLCRTFKKEMGIGFNDYLNSCRIEHARKILIRQDSISMAELAQECGFSDQSYFSKVFRKYVSITPGNYRKGRNM